MDTEKDEPRVTRRGAIVIPFYLPAGPAGVGAIATLRARGFDARGTLKLDVTSGGPVFLWLGVKEVKEAYRLTHPAAGNEGAVDFDLACSIDGDAEIEIGPGGLEIITVHSDNETIGFLALTPCR